MKKKIILTGAQGTGKSTVLKELENEGWNVITEVVRNLSKTGVKINEMGDVDGQRAIFEEYKRLFGTQSDYVSDRGLTDVAAYTNYLVCEGKIHPSVLWEQLEDIDLFVLDNPDAIFCYFPIEFPVVDDGVRSTNEEFRNKVDGYIKNILDSRKIPYIEVRGTVEERVNLIKSHLNSNLLFKMDK